jgi:hypothetical protein
MGIGDERDLRQQLVAVLDAITPPDAPVSAAVRRGKILQAGRSFGIVAGLAVAAGLIVGAPGLLRHSAGPAGGSPAQPTVMVNSVCTEPPGNVRELDQPLLDAGDVPGTKFAAEDCAWLRP